MKNKVLKTVLILMLIISLTITDLIVVGMNLVTYATNNVNGNVTFAAYFKTSEGEVNKAKYEINQKDMKLYMKISVESGIGFDGTITLENSNFKFKQEILSESISKIEGNTITLNRVRTGNTIEIEVGIEPIAEESYSETMLSKESTLKLTGSHLNSEEDSTSISKESKVQLSLLVPSNIEELTSMQAKVITNKLYQIGENNKRLVQIELNSEVAGNVYPIKTTTFNLELPEGVEIVNVISKGTQATNGLGEKTLVKDTDYVWNKTNKTLQVTIQNPIKDEKITWKQDGEDIIVITLIMNELQQLGEEEYSVKSNIAFYREEQKTVEKEVKYKLTTETTGIITSSIENKEEIYKGKIYSKEEREYNTTTKIEVNYSNVSELQGIELEEKTTYKTETEEKPANIHYKTTTIDKSEYEIILGTDANTKLIIKDQNGKTVKEVTIADFDETGKATITYGEAVTGIKIETTKPINTGIIRLNHTKVIKPEEYSIQEISTLKNIVERVDVKDTNEIQNTTTLETKLIDPKAEIGLTITPGTISSTQNNEMQISITLKSDNEKYELYANPEFKFTLPEGVTVNSVGNQTISASNEGFTVSKLEKNGREITLGLTGQQDKYVTSDINPQITFKANVNVDKLMANKQDTIKVEYINKYVNEEKVNQSESEAKNIISSNEKVVTHLKIENYNGTGVAVEKYSDNSNIVKAKLPIENAQIIQVPVKYTIINNYNTAITVNATIVANYKDNEENTQELINYNNSEIVVEAGKMQLIEQTIEIPAGLYFSEKVEIQTLAQYTYSSIQNSLTNNITLATEDKQGLRETTTVDNKVQVETFVQFGDGTGVKQTDELYNEQIVTYIVQVTNTSNEIITNLKIVDKHENGNIYDLKEFKVTNYASPDVVRYEHRYAELEETEKSFTIETLNPGETKEVLCRVVVKKTEQSNITAANIYISSDKIQEQNVQKVSNNVKDAELKIITEKMFTEEVPVYSNGIIYTLTKIKNLTANALQGLKGRIYLSKGIIYSEDSKFEVFDVQGNILNSVENIKYNKEENYIEFDITNIEANQEIQVKLKLQTKELELDKIESKETVYSNINNIISNKLEINVKQLETALSIVQTTNIKEGQKVGNGEKIIITGQIKNEGLIDTKISIRDSFPTGFNISKIELTRNGKTADKTPEEQADNIYITTDISKGETITIKIELTVDTATLTTSKLENIIYISSTTGELIGSNEIIVEVNNDVENDIPTQEPEEPGDVEEPNVKPDEGPGDENPDDDKPGDDKPGDDKPGDDQPGDDKPGDDKPGDDKPGDDKPGDDKPDDKEPVEEKYTISGYAWVDKNQNNTKDNDEAIKNVTVKIIDINNNNMFLKDENGKEIAVKTDNKGAYEIKNLLKGKYSIIFIYDTNIYEIKEETGTKDYIIENTKEKVAITNNINLEENQTIDLVLKELKEFDLKIDKYISKVVVQTVNGTKTSTYVNKQLAKEEIQRKYLAGATVLVEYTIEVSNIGELEGFATEIIDYIPEDMKFYSELNKQWYVGEDGNLYNTELASSQINPGQAQTVKLILSKTMTKNNTGTTTNIAEISETMNSKDYKDINLSNNKSQAEIIVNIATGTIITYTIAIINSIVILLIGMYIIKKKVLGKE